MTSPAMNSIFDDELVVKDEFPCDNPMEDLSSQPQRKRKEVTETNFEITGTEEELFSRSLKYQRSDIIETFRFFNLESGRIAHEIGTVLQNFSEREKSMEYYRESLNLTISGTRTANPDVDMAAMEKMEERCRHLNSQYQQLDSRLNSSGTVATSRRERFASFPFTADVCMTFFYEPICSKDFSKEQFAILGNAFTLFNMAVLNYEGGRRDHAAKLFNMSLLTIKENIRDVSPEVHMKMKEDILSLQAMIRCNLGYIFYERELYDEALENVQVSLALLADLAESIKIRNKNHNQQNQKGGSMHPRSDSSTNPFRLRGRIKCETNTVKVLWNKIFCVMKMESPEEVLGIVSGVRCIVKNLDEKSDSEVQLIVLMTQAVEAMIAMECYNGSPKDSSTVPKLTRLLQTVKNLITETKRCLGSLHPLFHTLLSLQGNIYRGLGQLQESKQSLLESLSLCQRIHGESHALTASSLINLGLSMYYQDELIESLNLLQLALKIQKREIEKTGEIRLDFLKTMLNIGQVWYARGFLQEAVNIYEQLFQEARKKMGPANVFVVDLLQTLALVLNEMGRTDESMRCFVQSANTIASMNRLSPGQNLERSISYSQMFSSFLQKQKNGLVVRTRQYLNGSDQHAAAA